MNTQIQQIQANIEPLRAQIINHKVYGVINDLEDLKTFQSFHVYAVWDFMSLLKSLQHNLTCTTVPWFPKGSADTRYLINEIVIGEESDVDSEGIRKSHFEMYLDAMQQSGADARQIQQFTATLQANGNFEQAYQAAGTPAAAREFVDYTFEVIQSGEAYLQAAIFTFGREDLIPGMFYSIINDLNKKFPETISKFKYYLERHIEVDGDHHSHLALEMTANLCGEDAERWQKAKAAIVTSLQKRIALWDGVYEAIMARKAVSA